MSYLKQLMDGFMTFKERRNVIIFFSRRSHSWRTWEQRSAMSSEQKLYEPEAPPMLSTCICFCFGLDCRVCVWMKALKAVRTRRKVSAWFPYIQYLHEYTKPWAKRAHSWPAAHLLLTNQVREYSQQFEQWMFWLHFNGSRLQQDALPTSCAAENREAVPVWTARCIHEAAGM